MQFSVPFEPVPVGAFVALHSSPEVVWEPHLFLLFHLYITWALRYEDRGHFPLLKQEVNSTHIEIDINRNLGLPHLIFSNNQWSYHWFFWLLSIFLFLHYSKNSLCFIFELLCSSGKKSLLSIGFTSSRWMSWKTWEKFVQMGFFLARRTVTTLRYFNKYRN